MLVSLALYALDVRAQSGGYLLAIGKVNPTEQESQECYFPIGQAASVNLHPDSVYCQRMREFIGKTGTLFFVPD